MYWPSLKYVAVPVPEIIDYFQTRRSPGSFVRSFACTVLAPVMGWTEILVMINSSVHVRLVFAWPTVSVCRKLKGCARDLLLPRLGLTEAYREITRQIQSGIPFDWVCGSCSQSV